MSRLPTKEGLLQWVDDYAVANDLDPREALIMHKFALYADGDMASWAKVETLARQGRSSERKIQYVLRDFEVAGVLRRTGEMHRLKDSTRSVPMYEWIGYLDSLRGHEPIPARRAPIDRHGCTDGGGMGAQGVHPHKELIEQTPSDEGDARTREREALFERLEAGFPKRGLCFTQRDAARAEFGRLLDHGVDPEKLIQAAAGWAADPKGKKSDLGLQYWLKDGRYRGTWPEAQLALEGGHVRSPAAPPAGAAPPPDQSLWDQAMAEMTVHMGETEFGAYLRPAFLGLHEGALHVVALTATARQRIAERRWRQVQAAWAKADPKGRPLTLVSKGQFEALLRQAEGVA